jgi:hypothetical protein
MAKSERLSGICLEGLNKMAEHLYYNYQPWKYSSFARESHNETALKFESIRPNLTVYATYTWKLSLRFAVLTALTLMGKYLTEYTAHFPRGSNLLRNFCFHGFLFPAFEGLLR